MLKHCGRAGVSRSLSDDYSTFEVSGSKGASRVFARSANVGSHAGPLLSKVKEPVVRLHVRGAGAHAGPKGGSVDDL